MYLAGSEGDYPMVMADLLFIMFIGAYYILFAAVPAWLVLGIIKIIRRNNPSKTLSTAFKAVSLILLIAITIWIFLLVLGSETITLM